VGATAAAQIAVVREGTGPEILLVHGGASPATTWRGLEPLRERWTLAYVHRRGYPPSPPPPGPGSDFDVDADDLESVLAGRPHVVAHSYGTISAVIATLRRPADVRSLTLIEPPFYIVDDPYVHKLRRMGDEVLAHGLETDPATLRTFLRLAGSPGVEDDGPLPDDVVRAVRRSHGGRSPSEAHVDVAALRATGTPDPRRLWRPRAGARAHLRGARGRARRAPCRRARRGPLRRRGAGVRGRARGVPGLGRLGAVAAGCGRSAAAGARRVARGLVRRSRQSSNGGGGIRTLEPLARPTVFETVKLSWIAQSRGGGGRRGLSQRVGATRLIAQRVAWRHRCLGSLARQHTDHQPRGMVNVVIDGVGADRRDRQESPNPGKPGRRVDPHAVGASLYAGPERTGSSRRSLVGLPTVSGVTSRRRWV